MINTRKDPVIKPLIEDTYFHFLKERVNIEELSNIYDSIVKSYFVRKEEDFRVKIASAEQLGNITVLNFFLAVSRFNKRKAKL